MSTGPNVEIDYSQFTYGPKQPQTSKSETQTSDFDTCESDCSVETHEPLPESTVNKPNVVCQPKVWSDAPIIEEYESDSEDEHVSLPTEEQETPRFSNKQVKTPRETVKNQFIHSKNPKVDNKGLGYGFTTKACFVLVKELPAFQISFFVTRYVTRRKVLFTDSECLVLSPELMLPDANQVLLRIPRQNNMYSFNLENIVPLGGTEDIFDAGDSEQETESAQDYFVLPIWSSYSSTVKRSTAKDAGFQDTPKTILSKCIKKIFSYYAGANLDRKSTIRRLSISWQEDLFLAMQKARQCGYFNYKAEYVLESQLGRYFIDGTEALMLPKLFILWLEKVSTDNVKLIPLGKDSSAIETLKKIPPRRVLVNQGGQSSSDKDPFSERNPKEKTRYKRSQLQTGRKSAKARKPSVHKKPIFDELLDENIGYMDTEDAQDVGRTRDVVNEEKGEL
ncbi:hypothetical protein Tco_0883322 [Tanacetum coccineum]